VGFNLRRLTFTVEPGADNEKNLVLRQNPILMDMDPEEQANRSCWRNVKDFVVECWDTTRWIGGGMGTDTNSIPTMVRVHAHARRQTFRRNPHHARNRHPVRHASGGRAKWRRGSVGGGGSGASGGQANPKSPTPNPGPRPPNSPSVMKISLRTNSGIALIIAMIAITVLSILAAGLWYAMKVETRLAQNADSETQLYWLGRSVSNMRAGFWRSRL